MKDFMHKVSKVILILLIIFIVINLGVIIFVYANHSKKLNNEAGLIEQPPGEMVEVGGHAMHVYQAGNKESDITLVFMHGIGNTDASIAMQPMFEALQEAYHIAYVDRSGNGYSEISQQERDIDTILEETRQALKAAGVEGVYVLIPHSTAGIEAIYWAQKYPNEIKGIIGVDMKYAEEFKEYDGSELGFKKTLLVMSKIGAQRYTKAAYPSNLYHIYSEKQIAIRSALIFANGYNKDMYHEEFSLGVNAAKSAQMDFPIDIPILLILANPIKDPYLSTDEMIQIELATLQEMYPDYDMEALYNERTVQYFSQYGNVTTKEMAGPSAIYTYIPKEIADEITLFMEMTN